MPRASRSARYVVGREASAWGPWREADDDRPATLLVPLDGSTKATDALSVARGLAHLKGATVVLVHVGRQALAPDELLGRMGLSAEDVGGLVIDQCTGSPADVILQEAAARHAALIVMCAPAPPDDPLHALKASLETYC